jgi:hypothetical protein
MVLIVVVFASLLFLGRYIRDKAERARAEIAEEARSLTQWRVRIATPTGAKPKRKDVTQRYAIETEVERRRFGTVIDASIGDDFVELIVAARDGAVAEAQLREILAENGLTSRSTIENVSPGS